MVFYSKSSVGYLTFMASMRALVLHGVKVRVLSLSTLDDILTEGDGETLAKIYSVPLLAITGFYDHAIPKIDDVYPKRNRLRIESLLKYRHDDKKSLAVLCSRPLHNLAPEATWWANASSNFSFSKSAPVTTSHSISIPMEDGKYDVAFLRNEENCGRLNRDGQKNPVTSVFLVCEEGSDPIMANVLGIKREQSVGVVDGINSQMATNQELAKKGRGTILAETITQSGGR